MNDENSTPAEYAINVYNVTIAQSSLKSSYARDAFVKCFVDAEESLKRNITNFDYWEKDASLLAHMVVIGLAGWLYNHGMASKEISGVESVHQRITQIIFDGNRATEDGTSQLYMENEDEWQKRYGKPVVPRPETG